MCLLLRLIGLVQDPSLAIMRKTLRCYLSIVWYFSYWCCCSEIWILIWKLVV